MRRYDPKIKFIVMLAAIFAAGVIYYILVKAGFAIPCIFHKLTGLYCPGCGVTTMCVRLVHLDFYGAFRSNPVVFVMIPIIAVIFLKQKYSALKYGKISKSKWITVTEVIMIIILILFGILRNIPCFAFLQPQ